MEELINPYANPFLPRFANQRPVIANQQPPNLPTPQMNYSGINFGQIHSVSGFDGARAYSLANGASEILAEKDPNMARIYVCAKDQNGQLFVNGFDLVPVEEPKPVTMDDINSKMNRILERLDKLEVEQNGKPNYGAAGKGQRQSGNGAASANGWNNGRQPEPAGVSQPNGAE